MERESPPSKNSPRPGPPWIILIIVALIVLSVLFGGFQKGTNSATGLNMAQGGPHYAARPAG